MAPIARDFARVIDYFLITLYHEIVRDLNSNRNLDVAISLRSICKWPRWDLNPRPLDFFFCGCRIHKNSLVVFIKSPML